MSLKLIPLEKSSPDCGNTPGKDKNKRAFNPGNKLKKNTPAAHRNAAEDHDVSLKSICLRLVHFINRGSRFTYEQIDELIMSLQRGVLRLQKKKQEMLRKKRRA